MAIQSVSLLKYSNTISFSVLDDANTSNQVLVTKEYITQKLNGVTASVSLASGGGLTNDNGIKINLATNSGLSTDNGLAVGAGTGISVSGNTVSISLNRTAPIAGSGNTISLNYGKGLGTVTENSTTKLVVKGYGNNITVDATNGVSATIPTWKSATAAEYKVGDVVSYNGLLYRCKEAYSHTTNSTWKSDKWDAITTDTVTTVSGSDGISVDPSGNAYAISLDVTTAKTTLGLGTAADVNTGTGPGNVPVLDSDGKLSTDVLPSLSIANIVTESEKTRLTTTESIERGDIFVEGTTTGSTTTYIPYMYVGPVDSDGKATGKSKDSNWLSLKFNEYELTAATTDELGGVKIDGSTITIDDTTGVITAATEAKVWVAGTSSATKSHALNEIVSYNGTWYICTRAHTDNGNGGTTYVPDTANSTYWRQYTNGWSYRGTHVTNTYYLKNDIVKYNGALYYAINASNTAPTNPTNWGTFIGFTSCDGNTITATNGVISVKDGVYALASYGVPEYTPDNANNVLTVNSNGTGFGWSTLPTTPTASITTSGSGSSITYTETAGIASFDHTTFSVESGKVRALGTYRGLYNSTSIESANIKTGDLFLYELPTSASLKWNSQNYLYVAGSDFDFTASTPTTKPSFANIGNFSNGAFKLATPAAVLPTATYPLGSPGIVTISGFDSSVAGDTATGTGGRWSAANTTVRYVPTTGGVARYVASTVPTMAAAAVANILKKYSDTVRGIGTPTISVTHGLNTQDILVQAYETNATGTTRTPVLVEFEFDSSDPNNKINLKFAETQENTAYYRIVILGAIDS